MPDVKATVVVPPVPLKRPTLYAFMRWETLSGGYWNISYPRKERELVERLDFEDGALGACIIEIPGE